MPARRLPWFKLWPEAMRHEKITLLSDGVFRTWLVVLAAGSEQSVRWRFASVKHAVSVTGRPSRHIRELIRARLVDELETGELWVHDWRQWQERYESDFAPRTGREDSANAPPGLRAEGEEEPEGERDADTPTPQPPPARGKGRAAGAAGTPGRGGRNGTARSAEAPPPIDVAPATAEDRAVWSVVLAAMRSDMTPGNVEQVELLVPIGRAADGGLYLRAPPGANGHLQRFRGHLARALLDAGDTAGPRVAIVEGR